MFMGDMQQGVEGGRVARGVERRGGGTCAEERGRGKSGGLQGNHANADGVQSLRLCVGGEIKGGGGRGGGLLPPSQTGFRRGVGCMDNVYVLNYLVNRQVVRKERKMLVLFVDLKAAFDSVDRGVLIRAMRKRRVREGLVARCGEVLQETVCRVRVGEEEGELFWTARGVRQGCPLSPSLFTLLIADMDEELEKGGWGGSKTRGEENIHTSIR